MKLDSGEDFDGTGGADKVFLRGDGALGVVDKPFKGFCAMIFLSTGVEGLAAGDFTEGKLTVCEEWFTLTLGAREICDGVLLAVDVA